MRLLPERITGNWMGTLTDEDLITFSRRFGDLDWAPVQETGRRFVEGHPEIYVVGDLAAIDQVPGIAPAAKQMGRHAAKNVILSLKNEKTRPFRYRDYGQLATIGRNAAVAMLGKVKLSGFPAWLVWLVAHIYFLINFRNRVIVMIDWGWAYLTYQRYARIIIGRFK